MHDVCVMVRYFTRREPATSERHLDDVPSHSRSAHWPLHLIVVQYGTRYCDTYGTPETEIDVQY